MPHTDSGKTSSRFLKVDHSHEAQTTKLYKDSDLKQAEAPKAILTENRTQIRLIKYFSIKREVMGKGIITSSSIVMCSRLTKAPISWKFLNILFVSVAIYLL